MPSIQQIFPFIPVVILAFFAWRYFQRGSLIGALLGGRITDVIGEIPLSSSGINSLVLKVSLLAPSVGSTPDIAVSLTSKAPFGASVVPFKLSQAQARELITLLERAIAR